MNWKTIVIYCFFIYLAALLTAKVALNQTLSSNVEVSAVAQPSINLGYLGYILGTLVIFSLLVIVFGKKKGLFRKVLGVYFFLFLVGMTFVLASVYVAGVSYWWGVGFSLACCTGVAYLYLRRRVECFNLFGVIIAITAPLVLGFDLSFWTIVILLVILAIYDYIAVFWTKHMVSLAKLTAEGDSPLPAMMIFGKMGEIKEGFNKTRCRTCGNFMVDYKCANCGRQIRIENKKVIVIKEGNPKAKKAIKSTFALGLGDLILPGIFPISLMLKFGMLRAVLAICGASIGVALNLIIVKRKNIMLPAMPLIVACMFIASVL